MAVDKTVRVKKKVKKNVSEGIAHVHASFDKVMLFHGLPLVVQVLKGQEKVPHLLRK